MKAENLHLFIHEELFIIHNDKQKSASLPDQKVQEAPVVSRKVGIVFIHQTTNEDELELLAKIIAACKLSDNDYSIFFEKNAAIIPTKCVFFTGSSDSYYKPHLVEETEVLHSKPLHVLKNSQEEKAKLWGALKNFV